MLFRYLFIVFFAVLPLGGNAQVANCPLNTPEFPFETQDEWWDDSYSWSAGLYMPQQLGAAHTINSISYRLDNTYGSAGTYPNISVYLRHTSVSNYSSSPGYPGIAGFTLVYSGNVTYGAAGTYSFSLSTPFAYNGTDNLELLIENRGGRYNDAEPWFDRTNDTGPTIFPGKVWAGSSWANATSGSSNRRFNLAIYTGSNNTSFCNAYPLAVTFKELSAKCENQSVVLNWTTTSEINNDYFIVEHSENGEDWSNLAKIDGNGTTTKEQQYSFVHRGSDNASTSYYRLLQVDFDGKSEYLQTIASNCHNADKIIVAPNPTNDFFQIQNINPDDKVELYNAMGNLIQSVQSTSNFVEISLSEESKGVFFANVISGTGTTILKVVKQ